MSLAYSPNDSALDSLTDVRRQHLEKLRWQLRVARTAIAAKRKEKNALRVVTPVGRFDKSLVMGFAVGGGFAALFLSVLARAVVR
jgi:hypothetical protein